jgi:Transposase DDE domain
VPTAEGDSARLELDRLLRLAPRQVFELAVLIGAEAQVPARLACAPVPPAVAQQRHRRARENARRQGYTPSQACLRRLDWTLLVTNVPTAELPTSAVATVARVRWQVELAFKLAKSDAALERTHPWAPQRVQCEFYAKLITLLLFNWLVADAQSRATVARRARPSAGVARRAGLGHAPSPTRQSQSVETQPHPGPAAGAGRPRSAAVTVARSARLSAR